MCHAVWSRYPAGESLTQTHARHQVTRGSSASIRTHTFLFVISFNAAVPSSASANSRLSVEFSCSSR